MRVLSIVHEPGPNGGGGTYEEIAARGEREHLRWLPPEGPVPGAPAEFDAVMVFGGAMHPDQDELHPWLPGEADFIRATLDAGVPLLGVCLGSQLLARAADGGVHPADAPEIGWCEVTLTPAGRSDPVIGSLPDPVTAFEWHYYAWDLPRGGELLATSPLAPQAFRLGDRAWGVQFHPEVTRAMLDDWYEQGADQLPMSVAEISAETDERFESWSRVGRALCEAFLAQAESLR